jgi:putative effector of murein hydrolase
VTARTYVAAAVAATPAYLCVTFAIYLLCRRIPARLQRLGLFPTVTAGVAMACIAATAGAAGVVAPPVASSGAALALAAPWAAGIQLYMGGAGAVLLYFVPPAVLGLAFRVHAQRAVLAANALPLAAALGLAIPGGFLLAAGLGRLAGLPPDLVLASLPKCTTTGLAVAMATQLGVDPSLVAAGCALSGTVGLSCGRVLMDVVRVRGAVARGVATGTSSHAAGTAALAAAGEEGAAAVSGVSFALSGVLGVLLLEAAPFRALLFAIAGAA